MNIPDVSMHILYIKTLQKPGCIPDDPEKRFPVVSDGFSSFRSVLLTLHASLNLPLTGVPALSVVIYAVKNRLCSGDSLGRGGFG